MSDQRDLDDGVANARRLVSDLTALGHDIECWRLLDPDAERDRVARSLDLYGFAARVHSLYALLLAMRDERP
jgi:hypothetical protein